MDERTALGLRMRSLLLADDARRSDVAGVVEWFGAMQAQDVNSGLWSFGVRLGCTLEQVNAALERREAIRTWPMRGTVHFVPPRDAKWMLGLMGPRALAGVQKRREILGIDEKTVDRAVEILAAALSGGGRLTRAQCLAAIAEGGVDSSGQRGYHLLWYASQRGVTAIAPHIGKEQTFVLLDEWVPSSFAPERDEALGIMALRYFRSHGPTTVKDFAGWTGLTMGDCRIGVAAATGLTRIGDLYVAQEILDAGPAPARWLALPGFDEYLLGFKDRSLMLADPAHLQRVIPGGNGVFRSTIVRDGQVVATWTRTLGRKAVTVTVEPLIDLTLSDRDDIAASLRPYADYLGLQLTVKNP